MKSDPSTVMIIDDEPDNLNVLENMLRMECYRVVAFPRGDLALISAERSTPDLILLDIRMPGLDGYEVCRRFKNHATLKEVPVIFLSGLMEPSDKVRAFEAGAVDYIVKPLSEPEVLARVRAQLALHTHALRLNELVKQRTAELAAALHRLKIWDAAKTHWITMLTHELRTPLTGLFCVTDMLFNVAPPTCDVEGLRTDFDWAYARIKKLTDDATLLATIEIANEGFDVSDVNLNETLTTAMAAASARDTAVQFMLAAPLPEAKWRIKATSGLLRYAIQDILFAAGCCAPENGSVSLNLSQKGKHARITIAVDNQTLPAKDLATFFDIGGQHTLCRGGADFGLGPALANKVIHLFEGKTSVSNDKTRFVIEILLPLIPQDQ